MCKIYTRFKNWLAYNPPFALGLEEWRSFKAEFRMNAPIRYYFYYTLPKMLYPIQYRFIKLHEFIIYRTTRRYHVIDTGHSPDYMSIDDRMLYGMFNLLKDYVEKDKAVNWMRFIKEKRSFKFRFPFYRSKFYSNPGYGIKYLEWEAGLDDPSIPLHEQSARQAITARETLALYNWWLNIRPERYTRSPPEYDNQGFEDAELDPRFNREAEDYKEYLKWITADFKNDDNFYEEDSAMLCRLINIRGDMW